MFMQFVSPGCRTTERQPVFFKQAMKTSDAMGEEFRPRYIFNKISEITPEIFRATGAKAAAVDLDNTLAYDGSFTPFRDAVKWLPDMQEAGIPVIMFTNTYKLRAGVMGRKFGVASVRPGQKPAPWGFARCAEMLGVEVSQLAMIGDQLFTDVRGANNAGAISVLVRPRHRELLLFFHYLRIRRLEREYLKRIGMEEHK